MERVINEGVGLLADKLDRLEESITERFDDLNRRIHNLELRVVLQESDETIDEQQEGEYECSVCRRTYSLKYQIECDSCHAIVCDDDSCSVELYDDTVCSSCYEANRKYK